MYCPKCDKEFPDQEQRCPECGLGGLWEMPNRQLLEPAPADWLRVILLLAGIASTVLLVIAGVQLLGIESESSALFDEETIMEQFYHGMGFVSIGLACFTGPLLIGLAFKDRL